MRFPKLASLFVATILLAATLARAEPAPNDPPRVELTPVPKVHLGDALVVCVHHLPELKTQAGTAPLGLFLDDLWMADLAPEPREPITDCDTPVRFLLQRTPGNKAAWIRLLGRPGERNPFVSVAVGTSDRKTLAVGGKAELALLDGLKAYVLTGVVLALLAIALLVLFKNNGLLRDDAKPPQGERPYSLGKVQFALWLFQVATAFFLIWGATGDLDSLTPSVLVLVGISAGTTVGAVMVGQSKQQQAAADHKDAMAAAAATNTPAPPAPQPPASEGFLVDILQDANGWSLHRVQALVWTVILSVVFWASVWHDLAMPVLSDTLLALMGISAGTYVGLKMPEKQS